MPDLQLPAAEGLTAANRPRRTASPNSPPPSTSAASTPRAVDDCDAAIQPGPEVAGCRGEAVRCGRRLPATGFRSGSRRPARPQAQSQTLVVLLPRDVPTGGAAALAVATRLAAYPIPTRAGPVEVDPRGGFGRSEVATRPRWRNVDSTCVHRPPPPSIRADSVHRPNQ